MGWWIALLVAVVLFLLWANHRTRGRGTNDRNGTKDHANGRYI